MREVVGQRHPAYCGESGCQPSEQTGFANQHHRAHVPQGDQEAADVIEDRADAEHVVSLKLMRDQFACAVGYQREAEAVAEQRAEGVEAGRTCGGEDAELHQPYP